MAPTRPSVARPSAERPADPPADALQRDAAGLHAAVSALVRVYQFRDRDRICCHDISVTQCHALEAVILRGPLRSQALAEALRLDKSTTTRVVDALVRKGYVARTADPDDARAVLLAATDDGRALHARIDADLVAQQAEALLGLTPEQRLAAIEVVRRLAQSAEARFVQGIGAGACCPPVCATGVSA